MNKLFLVIFLIALFIPTNSYAMRIGIISDIHAGNESIRTMQKKGNTIYPNRWEQCLKTIKADLVISVGDNVNNLGKTTYCNLYPRISQYVDLMAKGIEHLKMLK
jgi:metallophosphoesterase superfamily enzyme